MFIMRKDHVVSGRLILLCSLSIILTACGGGSGSSGGGTASSSYSIGGTITGLNAGQSVGLMDNGTDGYTATDNGSFVFGKQLDSGAKYDVTVNQQPSGEACQVTNGSGTIGQNNITNITVKCAAPVKVSVLYSFDAKNGDGTQPMASLIQGADGDFYGTNYGSGAAFGGGPENKGAVYKITPNGTETVLHAFGANNDGAMPAAPLVQTSDGSLYGTTELGGAYNNGTVFRITGSGVETVLHSFGGSSNDGILPMGGLILGPNGNFYGTTSVGGANTKSGGDGTVFKITPNGAVTVMHSFGSSTGDGVAPQAALVEGKNGDFYGTTSGGGAHGAGTVFRIKPDGTYTVLYSFGGGSNGDGSSPLAALIQGKDGNFYGTTVDGGSNNEGTVFKITPTGVETVLHSFDKNNGDGTEPAAPLFQAADGNFYGTATDFSTSSPGNAGTVFKITPDGKFTVLHTFGGNAANDGATPQSGLIQGTDGTLYGTTDSGGSNDEGSVYKISTK